MTIFRRPLLLSLLVPLALIATLSSRSPEDVRLQNPNSSPIRMTLNPETGFIEISLKSEAEITAYRFGCVSRSADGFILKKRFERVAVNFAERDYFINRASLRDLARRCGANDSFAVVEVEFRDGGQWSVRR